MNGWLRPIGPNSQTAERMASIAQIVEIVKVVQIVEVAKSRLKAAPTVEFLSCPLISDF